MASSEILICVLGLSRGQGLLFKSGEGVGKSCLCYRLFHPGFDDFISDHPSIVANHEFQSPAVNNVHWLYWGVNRQTLPGRLGKGERSVDIHVVENTVIYEDVTSKPFKGNGKADNIEVYVKRALGSLESSGKISYWTRDGIALPDTYRSQRYPTNAGKLRRGFAVVVDVSAEGMEFDAQLQRTKVICKALKKANATYMLVATKMESVVPLSLDALQQLKKKFQVDIITTSAMCNYNISSAFRVVAEKILKMVYVSIPTFEQAAENELSAKTSAKRLFKNFTTKWVQSSSERVDDIELTEQYRVCKSMVGKYETDRIFAYKLLEVKNSEMKNVEGNVEPEKKRDLLEDFIQTHPDLMLYCSQLTRKVNDLVAESLLEQQTSETPSISPKEPRKVHHYPLLSGEGSKPSSTASSPKHKPRTTTTTETAAMSSSSSPATATQRQLSVPSTVSIDSLSSGVDISHGSTSYSLGSFEDTNDEEEQDYINMKGFVREQGSATLPRMLPSSSHAPSSTDHTHNLPLPIPPLLSRSHDTLAVVSSEGKIEDTRSTSMHELLSTSPDDNGSVSKATKDTPISSDNVRSEDGIGGGVNGADVTTGQEIFYHNVESRVEASGNGTNRSGNEANSEVPYQDNMGAPSGNRSEDIEIVYDTAISNEPETEAAEVFYEPVDTKLDNRRTDTEAAEVFYEPVDTKLDNRTTETTEVHYQNTESREIPSGNGMTLTTESCDGDYYSDVRSSSNGTSPIHRSVKEEVILRSPTKPTSSEEANSNIKSSPPPPPSGPPPPDNPPLLPPSSPSSSLQPQPETNNAQERPQAPKPLPPPTKPKPPPPARKPKPPTRMIKKQSTEEKEKMKDKNSTSQPNLPTPTPRVTKDVPVEERKVSIEDSSKPPSLPPSPHSPLPSSSSPPPPLPPPTPTSLPLQPSPLPPPRPSKSTTTPSPSPPQAAKRRSVQGERTKVQRSASTPGYKSDDEEWYVPTDDEEEEEEEPNPATETRTVSADEKEFSPPPPVPARTKNYHVVELDKTKDENNEKSSEKSSSSSPSGSPTKTADSASKSVASKIRGVLFRRSYENKPAFELRNERETESNNNKKGARKKQSSYEQRELKNQSSGAESQKASGYGEVEAEVGKDEEKAKRKKKGYELRTLLRKEKNSSVTDSKKSPSRESSPTKSKSSGKAKMVEEKGSGDSTTSTSKKKNKPLKHSQSDRNRERVKPVRRAPSDTSQFSARSLPREPRQTFLNLSTRPLPDAPFVLRHELPLQHDPDQYDSVDDMLSPEQMVRFQQHLRLQPPPPPLQGASGNFPSPHQARSMSSSPRSQSLENSPWHTPAHQQEETDAMDYMNDDQFPQPSHMAVGGGAPIHPLTARSTRSPPASFAPQQPSFPTRTRAATQHPPPPPLSAAWNPPAVQSLPVRLPQLRRQIPEPAHPPNVPYPLPPSAASHRHIPAPTSHTPVGKTRSNPHKQSDGRTEPEYAYPTMQGLARLLQLRTRGVVTTATQKMQRSRSTEFEQDSDDYVHMKPCSGDTTDAGEDHYQNVDVIESMRTMKRSKSMEDVQLYQNFPSRSQRPQKTVFDRTLPIPSRAQQWIIPPRNLLRRQVQQTQQPSGSGSSLSPPTTALPSITLPSANRLSSQLLPGSPQTHLPHPPPFSANIVPSQSSWQPPTVPVVNSPPHSVHCVQHINTTSPPPPPLSSSSLPPSDAQRPAPQQGTQFSAPVSKPPVVGTSTWTADDDPNYYNVVSKSFLFSQAQLPMSPPDSSYLDILPD